MQAANQSELARLARQLRKHFAEQYARNGGGNCAPRSADIQRGRRLWIERLQMARPAGQVDEDTRPRRGVRSFLAPSLRSPHCRGQRQAGKTAGSQTQEIPTVNIAVAIIYGSEIDHAAVHSLSRQESRQASAAELD